MEAIERYRLKKKWSRAELANKLNVMPHTVFRWEKGERTPNLEILEKIADVLGVTVAELLGAEERKNEIEIKILIRKDDDEVGNVTMDMGKDAPFLQLVEISPHKTGLNLVFGPDVSLRDVCAKLLEEENKLEAARAAIYNG